MFGSSRRNVGLFSPPKKQSHLKSILLATAAVVTALLLVYGVISLLFSSVPDEIDPITEAAAFLDGPRLESIRIIGESREERDKNLIIQLQNQVESLTSKAKSLQAKLLVLSEKVVENEDRANQLNSQLIQSREQTYKDQEAATGLEFCIKDIRWLVGKVSLLEARLAENSIDFSDID